MNLYIWAPLTLTGGRRKNFHSFRFLRNLAPLTEIFTWEELTSKNEVPASGCPGERKVTKGAWKWFLSGHQIFQVRFERLHSRSLCYRKGTSDEKKRQVSLSGVHPRSWIQQHHCLESLLFGEKDAQLRKSGHFLQPACLAQRKTQGRCSTNTCGACTPSFPRSPVSFPAVPPAPAPPRPGALRAKPTAKPTARRHRTQPTHLEPPDVGVTLARRSRQPRASASVSLVTALPRYP